MTKLIVLAITVAALAFTGAASARTPAQLYVPEESMSMKLEQIFDHVTCMGVPRFGHRGAFPMERFRVFDCAISDSRFGSCPDSRYRVNGDTLALVTAGHCYKP